jgi:hypothetical protein
METVTLLREAYAKYGFSASETCDRYYICAVCGCAGLHVKNYAGQWVPESHSPPPRRHVNPSGKSGYYKR